MLTIDLSHPPPIDTDWLTTFTAYLTMFEPQLTVVQLVDQGAAAWKHTWLLDPDEAAVLWIAALRNCGALRRE